MALHKLYDDGGPQLSYGSRTTSAGLDRSNSCPSTRLRRTSDSHDITPAGCQDLSGCHIGMYLGR